MLTRRRTLCLPLFLAVLGSALGAAFGTATAQGFPTRPVRIVVPFAAGGSLDSIVRVIAEQLQVQWRQTVVVENRVGASGNIGADFVAHADADGHTLLASPPPPLAVNQFLFKTSTFKPSDFAIVAILASAPNVLIARPGVPASTLADLVALAKASPGKLNYASTGRGGTPHLTMEWFKLAAGVNLVHVPYAKGFAPALTDLLGGHVDLMFANLSDARHLINEGRLKAIAVASADTIDEFKDVLPISRELPGFVSLTWFALAAPHATPASILQKISADVAAAMKTPSVGDRLQLLSLAAVANTPAEAEVFVKNEAKRWRKVINLIGLQPE